MVHLEIGHSEESPYLLNLSNIRGNLHPRAELWLVWYHFGFVYSQGWFVRWFYWCGCHLTKFLLWWNYRIPGKAGRVPLVSFKTSPSSCARVNSCGFSFSFWCDRRVVCFLVLSHQVNLFCRECTMFYGPLWKFVKSWSNLLSVVLWHVPYFSFHQSLSNVGQAWNVFLVYQPSRWSNKTSWPWQWPVGAYTIGCK